MTRMLCAATAACLLLLAGCASNPAPDGGAVTTSDAERAFYTACTALPAAHAGFLIYGTFSKVDDKARAIEAESYATAVAVCDGPPPTSVKAALDAVQRAINVIALYGG